MLNNPFIHFFDLTSLGRLGQKSFVRILGETMTSYICSEVYGLLECTGNPNALKIRQFQNGFVKSSFLPKYERKSLCSEGRNFDNFFVRILGEIMTS